jgi:hypothetical protein
MDTDRRFLLIILNVLGGIAVLGSYALGLASHPGAGSQVWGGVPESIRPFYTVNMFLAAAGYFAFSFFVFFRLDPDRTRFPGGYGFRALHVLYALILFPSALWMPLTFSMLDAPSAALWAAIRLVLFLVGIGSLGLIAAVATARPVEAPIARGIAIAGAIPFAIQTALLDALIWPAYFPS